jgi:outer membrane protein TolC
MFGRCGSYRSKFETQLERNRARLREEREARERCQVDAAQAKAQLHAVESDRQQLAEQLESAMSAIAELRHQQPATTLPTPVEGVPPPGRQQVGSAALAAHFASPGLRYI